MIKWIVVSSESVFLLFRALLLFLVFDVSSFSAVVLLIKSLFFCQIKVPRDFWKSHGRILEKFREILGKVPRDFYEKRGLSLKHSLDVWGGMVYIMCSPKEF